MNPIEISKLTSNLISNSKAAFYDETLEASLTPTEFLETMNDLGRALFQHKKEHVRVLKFFNDQNKTREARFAGLMAARQTRLFVRVLQHDYDVMGTVFYKWFYAEMEKKNPNVTLSKSDKVSIRKILRNY